MIATFWSVLAPLVTVKLIFFSVFARSAKRAFYTY